MKLYFYRLMMICAVLLCASCSSFFNRSQTNQPSSEQSSSDGTIIELGSENSSTEVASKPPSPELDEPEDSILPTATNSEPAPEDITPLITPDKIELLDEQLVYSDALNDTWQDWSWGLTSDYTNFSPAKSGGASISITYDQAWGALYLHANAPIARKDYDAIRFWIHGGESGGQKVRVVLANEDDAFLAEGVEVVAQAQTWMPVEIQLTELGTLQAINGIAWQDAAGEHQPAFYLDQISLIDLDLPPLPAAQPGAGPALTVDVAANRHPISPDIYGINYANEQLAQELSLPVRRWGGNATTRYNWQNDMANRASDWFFENIPEENANPDTLPDGSAADRFVEQDRRTGTKTMMTVPIIGWTPKSREFSCGFSVPRYGPQQETDPWQPDCGNGVDEHGNPITNNDPTDTSLIIDPLFVQGWLEHLTARFGLAADGGVAYYSLDNEPMLWHLTHRDVHPDPVGYDELRDRTYAYGAAVKQVDSSAQTLGPALWGWTAYFYSALDQAAGDGWLSSTPDRAAHENMALIPWYLQQMQAYEQQNGQRILDYLDLHFYPQGTAVALSSAGNAETQALRLRSTRALWDPSYVDESWIDEPVRLIPRMSEWVEQNYPGTKLSLSEYNWGALDHINGALTQADLLGIFGREGLDLATLWAALDNNDPYAFAFRMYRNYDGIGGQFGDISVQAESNNQELLAIYAAERSTDGALTVMIINKSNTSFTSPVTISNAQPADSIQTFRYSIENQESIIQDTAPSFINGTASLNFPGNSITLLIISSSNN